MNEIDKTALKLFKQNPLGLRFKCDGNHVWIETEYCQRKHHFNSNGYYQMLKELKENGVNIEEEWEISKDDEDEDDEES